MTKLPVDTKLYAQIVDLLRAGRKDVVRKVNHTMVFTYSEIGRMIVEEEQNGQDRAEYGRKLIKNLSKILTKEFGKVFSVTNIQQMRNFYLAYQKQQTPSVESGRGIQQTLSADSGSGISAEKFALSWSHYLILMVKLPDENSTIGIVLCKDKKDAMVEITLPENNRQIFASKYKLVLPSKAALKEIIS